MGYLMKKLNLKQLLFYTIGLFQFLMIVYFILQLFITKDFYHFLGIIFWAFLLKKYFIDRDEKFVV